MVQAKARLVSVAQEGRRERGDGMSVIVRGMDMPKNCAECEMWSICECLKEYKDYESILCAVDDGDLVRADDCPLVEIPTPHGRLIDADKLNIYDVSPVDGFCVMGVTEADIGLADTVIEAEGSET